MDRRSFLGGLGAAIGTLVGGRLVSEEPEISQTPIQATPVFTADGIRETFYKPDSQPEWIRSGAVEYGSQDELEDLMRGERRWLRTVAAKPREYRCSFCGRRTTRNVETCPGCGAPVDERVSL